MKQNMCFECGESITNPLCPECIINEAIACLADKCMSGKITEWEMKKINEKLAAIIKANYTDEGADCIKCKSAFVVCPHCIIRHIKGILPRNVYYSFFLSSFSSAFDY